MLMLDMLNAAVVVVPAAVTVITIAMERMTAVMT